VVSVLALSAVDRGFEPKSAKLVISAFPAEHAAFGCRSKDWLACNQDNVSQVKQHVYT
jgi:hypothetical protein